MQQLNLMLVSPLLKTAWRHQLVRMPNCISTYEETDGKYGVAHNKMTTSHFRLAFEKEIYKCKKYLMTLRHVFAVTGIFFAHD